MKCAGHDPVRTVEDTMGRSMEPINIDDLHKMADIALADMHSLYERRPRWALYREHLLAVALCQGAALHYIDRKNGVKDIDLWSFFAEVKKQPFPSRRIAHADFGPSKFGRYPGDDAHYVGRRVDLIGRSLPVKPTAEPVLAIRTWLNAGSNSARCIRRKPVILVYPAARCGEVIWTGERDRGSSRSS